MEITLSSEEEEILERELQIQSDAAKSWLLEYHRWIRLDSDLLGRIGRCS